MGERDTKMGKAKRTQYTPEFRQERCAWSSPARASRRRRAAWVWFEKTLDNWVRARRSGTLKEAGNKTTVSAEQMGNSRLRRS
jgi:hypothetical protein